ncbi:MAG: hypothetical protein IJ048_06515 [Clostridia bacterium]|nr:hypothetical protein [Clostridia bacterium]
MTRSGQARKFARKTLRKTGGATRRVMCVQMALYTLIIAAAAALYELDGRGALPLGAFKPFLLPCAVFFMALVNLLINAPLTAIARKSGDGAFSRMNVGRVMIAILLALLPAAACWGLTLLAGLANTQWQRVVTWYTDWVLVTTANKVFGACAVAAAALVLLYVCGVIGVFARQMMLYMTDYPDRMKGASVGQIVRNGFGYAFTPVLMVIRSFFWFLLTLILTLALLAAACYITSPALITLQGTAQDIAMSFYLALTQLPAWAAGAVIALGCVWVLGLGLVFWPRFSMMRLYYHRLVMKDTDVM